MVSTNPWGLSNVDYARLEERTLRQSLSSVYGTECGRCGVAKNGAHSRRYCTGKMVERTLCNVGYVPVHGILKKMLKASGVSMVLREHCGSPLSLKGSRMVKSTQQPTSLYGPVWSVAIWRRKTSNRTSFRHPEIKSILCDLRATNKDPNLQRIIAGEEVLVGSYLSEAATGFLRVYADETEASIDAFRNRRLRAMRGSSEGA